MSGIRQKRSTRAIARPESETSRPVGGKQQYGYPRIFNQLDRYITRQQTGEDIFVGQSQNDDGTLAFNGGIQNRPGDIIAEHEQGLHGNVALLQRLAQQVHGRFAIGLLVFAHLPGTGAGNMNNKNFSIQLCGQQRNGIDHFLCGPWATYGDQ